MQQSFLCLKNGSRTTAWVAMGKMEENHHHNSKSVRKRFSIFAILHSLSISLGCLLTSQTTATDSDWTFFAVDIFAVHMTMTMLNFFLHHEIHELKGRQWRQRRWCKEWDVSTAAIIMSITLHWIYEKNIDESKMEAWNFFTIETWWCPINNFLWRFFPGFFSL